MAGTGKRIYGNVDIRDVQRCCPVTIKRTVNGTVERRNSSDVGVLCGGYVGMTVPDNEGGTAWQVSSRIPINKWARYKPVEPRTSGYVKVLTHAQREEVNFGITNIPVWNAQNCVYAMAMYWLKHIPSTTGTGGTTTFYPLCGDLNEDRFWLYQMPTSAFRLSDFAMNLLDTADPNYPKYSQYGTKFGYNGSADGPIENPAESYFYITPGGDLNIAYQIPAPSAEEYIHISDLSYDGTNYCDVTNSNFAVLMCRVDDSGKDGQVYSMLSCTAGRAVEPSAGGGGFAGLRIHFSAKTEVEEFLGQQRQKDFYIMPSLIRNSGTPTGDNNYVPYASSKTLPSGNMCMALLDRIQINISAGYANVRVTGGFAHVVSTKTNYIRVNYDIENFTIFNNQPYNVIATTIQLTFLKNSGIDGRKVVLQTSLTAHINYGQVYKGHYEDMVDSGTASLAGVYDQVLVQVQVLSGVILYNPDESYLLMNIPATPSAKTSEEIEEYGS